MALIKRNATPTPTLRRETVEVNALGGAVIVQAQLLSQRLELVALNAHLSVPVGAETEQQAAARAGAQMVSHTLARCVVLEDGAPLYSASEWDTFGAVHPGEVLMLFRKARVLNGQDEEETEKN